MRQRIWRQHHQQTVSLVKFELGGLAYALSVHSVRLVVKPVSMASFPGQGSSVLGVVKIRGIVVPVVDLRRLFDTETPEVLRWLLLQVGERVVGAAVDEVVGVIDVDFDHLTAAPIDLGPRKQAFVRSVADTEDGLVFVIDESSLIEELDRLVPESDWVSLAEQASAHRVKDTQST